MSALYRGLIVAGVLAAIAFVPVTYWIMGGVVKEAPFEDSRQQAVDHCMAPVAGRRWSDWF